MYHYRLVTVASGAASGKLLEYEVGGPRVSVQTAYGVEVEVGLYGLPSQISCSSCPQSDDRFCNCSELQRFDYLL